ncbi:hypothetical protein J4409_03010 [Candidatus Woesearchaeota archaeon]|nr:hypothetical protein [Candidatus Woesearchaeota archaeon]
MNDAELLKRKKLEEQFNEQVKLQQQATQIDALAKQYMTKEALLRYSNLKLAHPEKAFQVAFAILQAVDSGLNEKIDDNALKNILIQFQEDKKETKIKWQ